MTETYDPVKLEIFKHLFTAVAEEMGTVLRMSSYSPNIKERRDFSCALFDARGRLVAQAAHIPVHLGAMPLSVAAAIEHFGKDLQPGDLVLLNDPFSGGTHLPDITMVSPIFLPAAHLDKPWVIFGFAASRAHHADVGGMSPGSMPVAREIFQEGLIIPPVRLVRSGKMDLDILNLVLANVRTPTERLGDLQAQIAANQRGENRLLELASRYGPEEITAYMQNLITYTEKTTRLLLASLPQGTFSFSDFLDNDGVTNERIKIAVTITLKKESAVVDFSESAPQCQGSVNAVFAITLSAVYYVFRCLLGADVPDNAGILVPITVIAKPGTVVNALPPAAVAGGNVETSQRIVDVLLGALAKACPEKIPAASQGSMNNLAIGGLLPGIISQDQPGRQPAFAYYETIGGGMGARPVSNGPSAIHSHMTNTLNTPVEALEYAYPLRVVRYEIRRGSGGYGQFQGGDGIRRDLQALVDCQVTLLSDRRVSRPYGLAGGGPGQAGENVLIRDGQEFSLPGKGLVELKAGDVLSIRTPGGGGYGKPKE